MPVVWHGNPEEAPAMIAGASLPPTGGAPLLRAVLSPHRSLPPEGFAWFIGITFALILLPLIPLLGTAALWALLPFVMGAVWLIWVFLRRNYRDGHLTEELTLWPDRIEIRRTDPNGNVRAWSANPYWVRVKIVAKGGPVNDYLTLSGSGRVIELGAFLAPGERKALFSTLERLLARIRGA